jgi:hypothetical protein
MGVATGGVAGGRNGRVSKFSKPPTSLSGAHVILKAPSEPVRAASRRAEAEEVEDAVESDVLSDSAREGCRDEARLDILVG